MKDPGRRKQWHDQREKSPIRLALRDFLKLLKSSAICEISHGASTVRKVDKVATVPLA
jgi:hypothetical protein